VKYLFRGEKNNTYYYGSLVIRDGNSFIVNDKVDMPVYNVSLASPFKYQNGEYIFENDCIVYKINEASGIVRFSNGSFIVDFGSAEILLSEIYMYLREKK
jgi:hypothetical protein